MKRKNYIMPEMMILGIFGPSNIPVRGSIEWNGPFNAPKSGEYDGDEELDEGNDVVDYLYSPSDIFTKKKNTQI